MPAFGEGPKPKAKSAPATAPIDAAPAADEPKGENKGTTDTADTPEGHTDGAPEDTGNLSDDNAANFRDKHRTRSRENASRHNADERDHEEDDGGGGRGGGGGGGRGGGDDPNLPPGAVTTDVAILERSRNNLGFCFLQMKNNADVSVVAKEIREGASHLFVCLTNFGERGRDPEGRHARKEARRFAREVQLRPTGEHEQYQYLTELCPLSGLGSYWDGVDAYLGSSSRVWPKELRRGYNRLLPGAQ